MIKKNALWGYFFLTYLVMLLTWGVMAIFRIPGGSVVSQGSTRGSLSLPLLFLGGFSPTLAGLIMTWFTGRGPAMRDLWRRATRLRISWKWYLVILLLPMSLLGTRIVVQLARGLPMGETHVFSGPLSLIVFTIPLILIGGISEEFGWRGFALDRMLSRWTLAKTNLCLGLVWTFWHLPLFFIPNTIQQLHGNVLYEFPVFLVQVMGLTVIFSWLYLGTGRSLLAVILIHISYDWFFSFGGTLLDGGITDRCVNAAALAIIAMVILFRKNPGETNTTPRDQWKP